MGKSYAERMAELPKSEDLGKYNAESGRIKADLSMHTDISLGPCAVSSGDDWFVANITFSAPPSYAQDNEGYKVNLHYGAFELNEIFVRLKLAEAGIEELLRERGTDHHENWKETRLVMSCIISLEEQTKHLYEERKKEKKEPDCL